MQDSAKKASCRIPCRVLDTKPIVPKGHSREKEQSLLRMDFLDHDPISFVFSGTS